MQASTGLDQGAGPMLLSQFKSLLNLSLAFPGGSAGKESTCNAGDLGLIPGLGRSPREGDGYPLQYSGLEMSMDYSMGLERPGHN